MGTRGQRRRRPEEGRWREQGQAGGRRPSDKVRSQGEQKAAGGEASKREKVVVTTETASGLLQRGMARTW